MSGRCSVCRHPECDAINAALVAGVLSLRTIAARYGLAKSSLTRHRDAHLPVALVAAQEAVEKASADDLLGQVTTLERRARAILSAAEETGDLRTALAAIKETRGCLELLAKVAGELQNASIPRTELRRIGAEMAAVVQQHVKDSEALEAIRHGWSRIRF